MLYQYRHCFVFTVKEWLFLANGPMWVGSSLPVLPEGGGRFSHWNTVCFKSVLMDSAENFSHVWCLMLSLHPALSLRDLVSHLYKATDGITVLFVLICIVLDGRYEDRWLWTWKLQAFLDFNLFLISMWIVFLCLFMFFKNIWTSTTFVKGLLSMYFFFFWGGGVWWHYGEKTSASTHCLSLYI